MVLRTPGRPLEQAEVPVPEPGAGEVLIRVSACAVCRTDLHVVDGELPHPALPLVPGHQIVGRVVAGGDRFSEGERVGVPWLGGTCGRCRFCRSGRENLCDAPTFTGYDRDGGYADFAVAARGVRVPARRRRTRPRDGAAPVRGADRLPRAQDGGGRGAPGAVRLRRGRAHHLPGRAPRGPARLRLHARRGRRGAALRPRPGGGVGGRRTRAAARGAGCGDRVRARGSACPGRAEGRREGRRRSSAPAST